MSNRRIEITLVITAAALFAWGVGRAISRGEPAVSAWTTYAMVVLLVLSASNIWIQSRKIALPLVWICGIFSTVVVLAAILGVMDGKPANVAAVLRALAFFVLVGGANLMNADSSRSCNVSG